MCDAGAIGERGRVEFSPAMVVCRASSGADRSWLRSLAAAGPWLRRLAGALPGVSGSSRAGAHGPSGFGLLPPVSRFPRGRRNRAGDMGLFRRLAASLFVAIAASAFGAPALAQTTARMVEFEAPSGTTGILKATWLAPTDANRVRGYHVRYRIVGSSGFHSRRVVNQFEFFARYLDPDTTYEGQVCTVTEISRRASFWDRLGPCSAPFNYPLLTRLSSDRFSHALTASRPSL